MELFKKKIQGSGTTEIIISNVEMEKIMKIVNSLEESALLIKGVGEAIENEAKEQKGGLIYFMLNDKRLTDFTNLFPTNNFLKNDK